jgi:hypothetical protein
MIGVRLGRFVVRRGAVRAEEGREEASQRGTEGGK